ncbi:ribose 5-phosphate isomerase B [Rickettsiales bacterium]|nr:ribose 5-phosphate isomerase B [Rickettsiales bacterium]
MEITEKIIIASDHAGYDLKKKIINHDFKDNIYFEDLGAFNDESVDYPDYAHNLGKKINLNYCKKGILICGTGIGMSMVANRYENVRAALCLNEKMAKLSREHNNANVIVLGSRLISFEQAIKCLNSFFSNEFEKGRHELRIKKFNN